MAMPRRDPPATGRSMGVRDRLALDRTVLANERTLLAYLRTALALLILGISLIGFFDRPAISLIGWACIALSVVMFIVGYVRYRRMDARIGG